MERPGRETSRLQNDVTRRIDDFQRRGVLIPKMADHYKKAIQKARGNPIKFKVFLKQVQEDLDRLDNEATPVPPQISPTSSTLSSGTSASVSAFTEIASAVTSNASSSLLKSSVASGFSRPELRPSAAAEKRGSGPPVRRKSELEQAFSQRSLRSVGQGTTSGNNVSSVTQPSTQRHAPEPRKPLRMIMETTDNDSDVGDDQMQELFVEMCFFARLGYVQPPCCLRCTYKEALMDKNENMHCSRWVIWRKDTRILLHPLEMQGNLLMVQCRAARKLLAGEIVNGYRWSPERQEIYSIGS